MPDNRFTLKLSLRVMRAGCAALALLTALSGCGTFTKSRDAGEEGGNSGDSTRTAETDGFVAMCQTLGETASGAVAGREGWLFAAEELREIGKTGTLPATHREALAGIIDYHEQLRKAGIELVVVPVPQKAIIYSEQLGARATGRLDTYLQGFYDELRASGVHVVDLVPSLRRERDTPGGVFPKTASHLSPWGAEIAAQAIVTSVKDSPWTQALEPDPNLIATPMQITLLGNLAGYAREDETSPTEPESLPIRAIGKRTVSGVLPAARAGNGRIILITSEQEGLAYGAPGMPAGYDADLRGSLADQLIYELGTPIDVFAHATSGANTARVRLLRASMTKPALLSATTAVIWAFSASELTRPGWRKVPLNLELRQSEETINSDTNA